MSILDFTTTRDEWLDEIENKSNSYNSRYAHEMGIRHWDRFLETVHQTDELILKEFREKNNDPQTYLFLNKYIQYLNKQGLKRATIDLNFAALRSWCASNGVMLFNEYIKRFVNLPKQNKETKAALTHEIIRLLIKNTDKRVSTILLILLSSGMRIGECLHLKVIDISQNSNPIEIKIRAATTKTREQRTAYISAEAWEALKPMLTGKEPDEYIFIKKFTRATLVSFEMQFWRLRKKLGLTQKYDDGRNYHVNVHAFRAYFHTQATRVLGGDIAHALIGHRQYLDQYFRLTPQEKSDMYHKLEPYVTVSNEARQKTMIEDRDKQLLEMHKMEEKMRKMEAKMKRIEMLNG